MLGFRCFCPKFSAAACDGSIKADVKPTYARPDLRATGRGNKSEVRGREEGEPAAADNFPYDEKQRLQRPTGMPRTDVGFGPRNKARTSATLYNENAFQVKLCTKLRTLALDVDIRTATQGFHKG